MINLTLFSNASQHGSAEMHIDYQNGSIAFAIIESGRQFDFNVELHEWELLKKFIDIQIETINNIKQ